MTWPVTGATHFGRSADAQPNTVTTLTGARIVVADGVIHNGWITIEGTQIVAVGPATTTPVAADVDADEPLIDLQGAWLVPGFIDLHMHGGGGHDASNSPADMSAAVAFHQQHGTTRTLISLAAAPVDELCQQLVWVAELSSAQIVGAHLEGPFLAHARCGAQNPAHLLAPDLVTLRRLIEAARGRLSTITIAPELPGAPELITAAITAGVVVAIGHSDATYEQATAAYASGVMLTTHLFNAMAPFHHRAPGIIGAAFESEAALEVINDGIHVHPSITALVNRATDRLVLITDAIAAAGAPDGEYSLAGQAVRVTAGAARLVSTAGVRPEGVIKPGEQRKAERRNPTVNDALAGSTLTMDDAFRRAVRECDIPIERAVAAASTNPARVLGLSHCAGAIAVGCDADLVVMDDDLRVVHVAKGGRWTSGDLRTVRG